MNALPQHKTVRRQRKCKCAMPLNIKQEEFKRMIKTKLKELSIANKDELIPNVRIKDNRHWIEWVLIIQHIDEGQNEIFDSVVMVRRADFGVFFRYDKHNKIIATSICFDRKDIENKYKLTGMRTDKYNNLFDSFSSEVHSMNFLL